MITFCIFQVLRSSQLHQPLTNNNNSNDNTNEVISPNPSAIQIRSPHKLLYDEASRTGEKYLF